MIHPLHSSRSFAATVRRLDEEEHLNVDRKKSTPASSPFPDQLLEEILCRMPVRILTRFRCVCKSWRDLISSEEFIILHLKKYKTSVILVNSIDVGLYESGKRGSISPVYPPSTPLEARSGVDFTLPESVNNKVPGYDLFRPQITSAACNGIICLWDIENPDNIALWNPATKDLNIIPKSNLPRQSNKLVGCRVVFGYDDVRNDYKIIQVLRGGGGGGGGGDGGVWVQFELYSLKSGLWKKLDISGVITEPDERFSGGIHSTGDRIVCWLVFHKKEKAAERRWELVLFDMSTERFEIVQVPVEASEHSYLELKPYEGSIGVMDMYSREQVWVLNDIYSPGGGLRSWRKVNVPIYSVYHRPKLFEPRVVAFWEDHWLSHDDKTRRLIIFDRGRQKSYPVGISKHRGVFTAIRYKESLVRLH